MLTPTPVVKDLIAISPTQGSCQEALEQQAWKLMLINVHRQFQAH